MVKKILLVVILCIIIWALYNAESNIDTLWQRVTECEKQLEEKPKVVFVTTIVTATPTPTLPVSPILYTSTPTPSPEPTPIPTCTTTPTPKLVKGTTYKPYTDYRCYNIKGSREYQLQQLARTDIYGLRVVTDSNGEERYCVALGTAWAGGKTNKFAGTCVDIYMDNGTVLKCVYGDVKKAHHTINGEGKYGLKGELIEFIIDTPSVPEMVRIMGDASYCAGVFKGAPLETRLRDDVTIPGLD